MAFHHFGPMSNPSLEDDHELYLSGTDLIHHPRAVHLQRHLTHIEDSTKGHCFPPYASWTDEPVPPYHVAFPNVKMELHSPAPYVDRYPSPWSGDLSSTSGPDSPRSTGWGNNVGCYMSPPYTYEDSMIPSMDLGGYPSPDALAGLNHSVSPYDVQHYPEPESMVKLEPLELEPIHRVIDHTPSYEAPVISSANTDYHEPLPSPASILSKPQITRRRRSAGRPSSNGVSKPNQNFRRLSPRSAGARSSSKKTDKDAAGRLFVCSFAPYGCTSTFVSKNEWKRHVSSQHIQLGFYRCDIGACNVTSKGKCRKGHAIGESSQPNDFNRKDLFTQHQRRMHAPWQDRKPRRDPSDEENQAFESQLEEVRKRCWHQQRQAPAHSTCGFCGKEFMGERSWDERMEHVGRHFEKEDKNLEKEDLGLRDWAIREGIVQVDAGKLKLASLCGG
ncbi:hypothetical protein ASPWEDRAFT_44605 [Aspergillus wentii DTO 134E9]|uniref:C2H2-type domain-containing protein n=1 Tax=Aspergillus wentii DTO 134E9 TaxID=1073089 RepID=A0A1L9RC29_ASPWE|nr:uncharacterized protein ASPWEDRAFT_44605 [Aspergillus wentii DTO 134E9]KAI9935029.1 hypothetical protein MW887_000650 [Aspergillus wentii]OJJ32471.1 hypothetical protein ASPWEDRAFT_44605 [Aspergillus wentii DTO 134E9]